ncbi:MAG: type II secretion system protein, partial [Candidatus Falkowbacteria bacterium]|nr:type II secretion system protein [Candidatus Falkowbacteria bacterium]
MRKKLQGITLLELLITIGIFSILATVLVFAINPVKRFQDSRDLARWSDVNAILSAIKIDKINNFGNYMVAIKSIPIASSSEVFMITDGGASSG